jgi:integrase
LLRLFATRKSLVLEALARQSLEHCATAVSSQSRAERCSNVEFRRISLQAIARGVSTSCPQNPVPGSSPLHILYRPGGKPRRRKRVFSEEELRSFVTNIDSICRTKKRKHVLMVLLLTMQRRGEHAVPLTRWAIEELKALRLLAKGSRFVVPGKNPDRHADPKLITRSVKRLLPRFLAHGIEPFVPHDLRRSGRTTLGRLGVSPFVGERVINHSKGVLEETYDLWDYFDEKRDALERLEAYLLQLRDNERAGPVGKEKQAPRPAEPPLQI